MRRGLLSPLTCSDVPDGPDRGRVPPLMRPVAQSRSGAGVLIRFDPQTHRTWQSCAMADVELRQLRYLVAVAERGSFTTAAEQLTMTQPALSRAVAALERTVGVRLLDRTSRGVVLTAAGKVLVDRAEDILGQVNSAVTQTREAGNVAPPLRISSRGCDIVIQNELVRAYNRRYPADHAELVEADWHAQLADLRTDVAQIALVSGEFESNGLESEILTEHERVALVSASHPLAGRRVVDRVELLPDPVITWTGNTPAEREYWRGVAAGNEGGVVAGPQVNDGQKLLAHVRLGTAIAFLPRPHLEHGGMPPDVAALRVEGLAPAHLRVVWAEHQTSLEVARFVRFATAAYAAS
jgi:DNA-binding transcriptional LysR family regulator